MKKLLIFSLAAVLISTTVLFSTNLKAEGSNLPERVTGQITMVDQDLLKIREDRTQTEYAFIASRDQLRDVSTGFRVEVKSERGKINSLTILGMSMKAEPEPFQKWKVIKYPHG